MDDAGVRIAHQMRCVRHLEAGFRLFHIDDFQADGLGVGHMVDQGMPERLGLILFLGTHGQWYGAGAGASASA